MIKLKDVYIEVINEGWGDTLKKGLTGAALAGGMMASQPALAAKNQPNQNISKNQNNKQIDVSKYKHKSDDPLSLMVQINRNHPKSEDEAGNIIGYFTYKDFPFRFFAIIGSVRYPYADVKGYRFTKTGTPKTNNEIFYATPINSK